MRIASPERALEVLKEFLGFLDDYERIRADYDFIGEPILDTDEHFAQAQEGVLRLQPLVEKIAQEIARAEGDGIPHWFLDRSGPEQERVQRLIGILEGKDAEAEIFGPSGPTLAAKRLHRWVWKAAVNLWDGGHFKQAVHAAASAVEEQTKLKLGRAELSGRDLYAQALSKDPGRRLRFKEFEEGTDDWTSAHEGAMYFGMGCTQRIRNLQAHGTRELGEQEALECLAALSLLARWVEAAELKDADLAG